MLSTGAASICWANGSGNPAELMFEDFVTVPSKQLTEMTCFALAWWVLGLNFGYL